LSKKTPLSNEQITTLGTVKQLNDKGVRPDKGRIFTLSLENDHTRRYEYYDIVDGLVQDELLELHIENYGSAARWFYFSITAAGIKELRKALKKV